MSGVLDDINEYDSCCFQCIVMQPCFCNFYVQWKLKMTMPHCAFIILLLFLGAQEIKLSESSKHAMLLIVFRWNCIWVGSSRNAFVWCKFNP